jgi:hypothetical protein
MTIERIANGLQMAADVNDKKIIEQLISTSFMYIVITDILIS